MIMFWLVAALFVGGALLLLLPPLWNPGGGASSAGALNLAVHRDQMREAEQDLAGGLLEPQRLEQVHADIRRRALEEAGQAGGQGGADDAAQRPAWRTALVLGLSMPLASLVFYLQVGRPDAAVASAAAASKPAAEEGGSGSPRHALGPEQIEQRATALAERLKANPGDADGWLMLGRSYTALGRFQDAATALRRAVDMLAPDAGLLADLADITAMAQGKRLAGEPARLVQRALDLDPRHAKSLALAGSVAFEARDYDAARDYWQRLMAVLPPGSPMLRSVQGSLAQVAQLAGATVAQPAASIAAAAANSVGVLTGTVVLTPELAARLTPGATLFVFARPANGSRMPLAVQRQPARAGTIEFRLDDSMALQPGITLSGQSGLVLGARISASGQATPQSGDLLGQLGPVQPGSTGLRILIDRVQP